MNFNSISSLGSVERMKQKISMENAERKYAKTKTKFLKKYVLNQDNHIVDMMDELQKLFTPENVSKLLKRQTSGYYLLTRNNLNTNSKPCEHFELVDFYKKVYDAWYDYLSGIKIENVNNEKTAQALTKLMTNKRFSKANMTPQDCEDFFYETYDNEFSKAGLRALRAQNSFNGQNDFIHVHPFLYRNDIDCRLYLNLKTTNCIKVANLLVDECKKMHKRVYFKFWTGKNTRNDTFLIYTNYAKVEDFVTILTKMKKQHPVLFEGVEKGGTLLPKINGFIGFGEEPKYKHSSFNDERGNVVNEVFEKCLSKSFKLMAEYKGTIKTSKGEELNLRDYLKYRVENSFLDTLKEHQRQIKNHVYPQIYKTQQQIDDYVQMEDKIYNTFKNGDFSILETNGAVDRQVDNILESMRKGNRIPKPVLKFSTQKTSLSNKSEHDAQKELAQKGFVEYPVEIDIDLNEKLWDVFQGNKIFQNQLTPEMVKHACDNNHVSSKYPALNLESENELINSKFFGI